MGRLPPLGFGHSSPWRSRNFAVRKEPPYTTNRSVGEPQGVLPDAPTGWPDVALAESRDSVIRRVPGRRIAAVRAVAVGRGVVSRGLATSSVAAAGATVAPIAAR